MFRSPMSLVLAAGLVGVAGFGASHALGQVGTGFTYQGQLQTAGSPANGVHDLKFRLFDAAGGGTQVGTELCANDITVVDGRFSVILDFGAQFAGAQRHLEIDVRTDTGLDCTDQTGYNTLAPRQNITPAPYAIHSLAAGSALTASTATNANQLGGQAPAFYTTASNLTGTLANARTTATSANTASAIVARDASGNFVAGTITAALNGNATTATNATQLNGQADTFYRNASNMNAGTIANARTSATSANTASAIVARDASGNFTAGTITASLNGNAATATTAITAASATTATTASNATQLNGQAASFYTTASNLTGTLADARLTSNVPRKNVPNTFTNSITAPAFFGNGAGLTNLDAGDIAVGTLADARLSGNVALLNSSQTYSGTPAFNGGTASLPPFTVNSTTVVTNLNADLLDGVSASEFFQNGDSLEVIPGNPGTETVDVSQTTWNIGLPMDETWQSFTAGSTGELTGVTIHTNGLAGTVNFNLRIYAGTGTGGTLLSSTPITLNTNSPSNSPRKLVIPAIGAPTVTAGQVYTWHIQGGPSWIGLANSGNPYPGGRSGFSVAGYDAYFQTHVTTGFTLDTTQVNSSLTINSTNVGSYWQLYFRNSALPNSVGGMRLSDDGFLDVTNVANGGNFARLSSTGAWGTVSDRRIKKDIEPAVGNLDAAMRLRPVTYGMVKEEAGSPRHLGFIAQEVREVIPEYVVGDETKTTLSVNYAQMSVVAIGAVQELKAKNDALESKNAALEARLAALESIANRGGLTATQSAGLGAAIGLPLLGFAAIRRRKAASAAQA
jgi:hypothetical protein